MANTCARAICTVCAAAAAAPPVSLSTRGGDVRVYIVRVHTCACVSAFMSVSLCVCVRANRLQKDTDEGGGEFFIFNACSRCRCLFLISRFVGLKETVMRLAVHMCLCACLKYRGGSKQIHMLRE